jgi:hypothetical protein
MASLLSTRTARTNKAQRMKSATIRRAVVILAEAASSWHKARGQERALSAECHRQQARAQEHEAGRRQRKESVGDNVVVAHETPTDRMLVRIY